MPLKLNHDIAIYGIQGSGKTTQAQILAQKTGATLFYLGGEIRKRMETKDEIGKKMTQILNSGDQVDGQLIKIIFDDFIKKHSDTSHFIFDTPARNFSQKPVFDNFLQEQQRQIVIIFLDLDEDTTRQRLTGQSKRGDTSPTAINRRIELFYTETIPVIEEYRKKGIPILEIDASPDIETIAQNIETSLQPYIQN